MTAKEAREILETAKAKNRTDYPLDYAVAMEMAITALGAIEQIMWERDMAISQLEEIGVSFGEKMDEVKEALEKQIAKKLEIYTDTRNYMDMYGNVTDIYEVDIYECPNCGAYITERFKDDTCELVPNYCNNCGQKFDWSEEE